MQLKKGLFYVFIATFINLVVNVISGFLLPKFLSIDTYAQIALYQLYITYVGILHLGFSDGIYLKYGGMSIKDIKPDVLYSEFKTFKGFQLLITVLAVIICLLTNNTFLLICALSILPINISNYLRNLYQATGQFKKYARFTNINTFLVFLMNIILLFILKTDYYLYYLLAYLGVWTLYWLFLEWEMNKIVKRVKVKMNLNLLIGNVKEGFTLMSGNFSVVLLTTIDRLFVKRLMGLVEFAYFSFAVNLQGLLNVFITPISTIMYNFFCKYKEYKKIMLVKNVILLISAGLISSAFIVKFVVEIYIDKYIPALEVVFVLFAAQFFIISIRTIFNNLYKALRKQGKYLRVILIVIVQAIALNTFLYLMFHSMLSIAVGTLISSITWFILCEHDFAEYKYTTKKIFYIFIVILSFLIAGLLMGALIGLLFYILVVTLATLILMKPEYEYLLKEINGLYRKVVHGTFK